MRKDMPKLLMDWPRLGGKPEKGNMRLLQRTPQEELPSRESLRQRWKTRKQDQRYCGTNALRRFLFSHLGRKWDDVYGQICRSLPADCAAWHKRARHFIDLYVETNISMIDGKPHDAKGFAVYGGSFWVHPESGLLMYEKQERHSRADQDPRFKQMPIDQSHKAVQIKGIWYKVTFQPVPGQAELPVFDIVLQRWLADTGIYWEQQQIIREWGALICAVDKQQMSKREIRLLRRVKPASSS